MSRPRPGGGGGPTLASDGEGGDVGRGREGGSIAVLRRPSATIGSAVTFCAEGGEHFPFIAGIFLALSLRQLGVRVWVSARAWQTAMMSVLSVWAQLKK